MAKISVIVPIYGVEKYLRECLDSILAQTLTDIEILLLDDGSKDNCPQIIDEYAQEDSRIKVIHKANGGYGHTCNCGLDNATGEYISIIEPDDYIGSEMFEDLYKIAKNFDSDIVKSGFYDNLQSKELTRCIKTRWDNDKIPQKKSFAIKECPLFLYYHPSIWSCIYKREFLSKHNIRFVEAPGAGWTDNPFQVQTMCLAQRINYTPEAYYYWRRTNFTECDDLKDWEIPFKRSYEIHNWLETNNINDEDIISCLNAREMTYINIILRKNLSSDELNIIFNKIAEFFPNINVQAVINSTWISNTIKSEIKKLSEGEQNYYKYFKKRRRKEKFKELRKKFLSIHISKNEVSVIFLGKYWRFNEKQ